MEIPPSKIEAAAAAPAWFILVSTYNGECYSFPSANYAQLFYGTLKQILRVAATIAEDESGCCCRGQCACDPVVAKDITRCLKDSTGHYPVLHYCYTHSHGDCCEDHGSVQIYRYSPKISGIKIIADSNDCEFLHQKCFEETHAAYAANTDEETISDDEEFGFFYTGDDEEHHRLVDVSNLGAFKIIDSNLGDGYTLEDTNHPNQTHKIEKKIWVVLAPMVSRSGLMCIVGEGADENLAWVDAIGEEWESATTFSKVKKVLNKYHKKGWEARQVSAAEYEEIETQSNN